jgi:hypothetical protein
MELLRFVCHEARWGLGQRVPLMGVCLAPPLDELFSPSYADAADRGKGTWCNLFENLTTVQFDHCVIEMTMYLAMALLFMSIRRAAVRGALPPPALRATAATFAKVNVQAALGISSLLYLVRCLSPLRIKWAASRCSRHCSTTSWRSAHCRCTSVAAGEFSKRGGSKRQGRVICPSILSSLEVSVLCIRVAAMFYRLIIHYHPCYL